MYALENIDFNAMWKLLIAKSGQIIKGIENKAQKQSASFKSVCSRLKVLDACLLASYIRRRRKQRPMQEKQIQRNGLLSTLTKSLLHHGNPNIIEKRFKNLACILKSNDSSKQNDF